MKELISIIWFRSDLRLTDNLALKAAIAHSPRVIPLYIWSPEDERDWPLGAASRWWLHQSLKELDGELKTRGSQLIIRSGGIVDVLKSIIEESGATNVFCNQRFDPAGIAQEEDVTAALQTLDAGLFLCNSSLLHEPSLILNKEKNPFRVFTPYWNHVSSKLQTTVPAKAPDAIPLPRKKIDSLSLSSLELEPTLDWADGFREYFTPGEQGAQARLKEFINKSAKHYSTGRDRPDLDGVSMLSPHLHFGEIGPRQIWYALKHVHTDNSTERNNIEIYLKEIGWREFAHYILYHFPETDLHPMRPEFKHWKWAHVPSKLRAWQKGQTGYPIVDAGMRQLWHTGWMHNRVRMIVASFLTKDLLVSWNDGAQWFWDTLVDADLANNTLGWQWTAGCGADAAPYFRIFNPALQGEKFDPDGDYVRKWVPELAKVPSKWIHKPGKAPQEVLDAAGVELGKNYPKPIVDHDFARKRALELFAELKNSKKV